MTLFSSSINMSAFFIQTIKSLLFYEIEIGLILLVALVFLWIRRRQERL